MTRAAGRNKGDFIGMMRGRVVTGQTRLIADLLMEKSQRRGVASLTLFAEGGVGIGKRAAAVDLLRGDSRRRKPNERYDRNCNRKPEAPLPERMGMREVLQVHPL